jgi:formate hydrogenlyase subunit 6/NADH:ubiquinone oxidoreductase subunit I
MAFVDRGRCLPWAMDTPCIVCQENCPVSPKAIFTRAEFRTVRDGRQRVAFSQDGRLVVAGGQWASGTLAGGDCFMLQTGRPPAAIAANDGREFTLAGGGDPPGAGDEVRIAVRLQKPYVDPHRCIGCGICEHECPVQGRRAIRVSAENASRHSGHRMVLR